VRTLTRLVVPAQLLFLAALFVAQAVQRDGYKPSRYDISDLGSLTADHPWVLLVPEAVAGVVTAAFALLVLRRVVGGPGPWLLAASLVGLDDVSDALFRLDCRRVDPGCTDEVRTASWHAQVHEVVGFLAVVATVLALLALAHRFRRLDRWADLARPAVVLAGLFLAAMLVYAWRESRPGGGIAQRLAVLLVVAFFAALVRRVLALSSLTRRRSDRAFPVVPERDPPGR
jgi:hypothetical membrane protein